MNLNKIRAFVAVLDHKSFSEAAEHCGRSQPAISQQIKSLEEDLGLALLDRSYAGVQPTPAGNYIYKMGRRMLKQWEEIEEGAQAFQGTLTSTLRIGASTIPAAHLLPRWIRQFHHLYPKVDLVVESRDSRAVLSRLHDRQVSAAIVGSAPSSSQLVSEAVAVDSLVLIAPNHHPVNAKYAQDPCELVEYDFIVREVGSGTREAMEKGLTHCGLQMTDLKIAVEVDSTESLIATVEQGIGISFVSKFAAAPAVAAGRIRLVSVIEPFSQSFYFSCLKNRREDPLIKAFASVVFHDREDGNSGE
ncbi:MAG TPA: selenium metabolism-associated LysR family transcriptional regulator [Bacillales bacterium]|nr:selenium metabolism-associated LysR family transcriptional regulator [Bacillales bacterium]